MLVLILEAYHIENWREKRNGHPTHRVVQYYRSTAAASTSSCMQHRRSAVRENNKPSGAHQGFTYPPVRPNRCGPVPVYWSGLAGNRSVPVEVKFEFKFHSSNGSYRYTDRFDRFTGRFERFTGQFDW